MQAVLLAGASLALGACGILPDRPQQSTQYDFGPAPASAAPATATAGASEPPLVLPDIDAPARLDGTRMLYRLDYADANELLPYAHARWSMSPAQLLRQRLQDALGARRTVLTPAGATTLARDGGKAPETLRVTLEDFSQNFSAPAQSEGRVRVRATLLRPGTGGDQLVAQRVFSATQPAPTPDAAGGVKALAAASDAVVAQVVNWVAQQPR